MNGSVLSFRRSATCILIIFIVFSSFLVVTIAQGKFCGSRQSNIYHYPSCYWAKQISPKNLIWFRDEYDAVARGYRACKVCRPPSPTYYPTLTTQMTTSASYARTSYQTYETYSTPITRLTSSTQASMATVSAGVFVIVVLVALALLGALLRSTKTVHFSHVRRNGSSSFSARGRPITARYHGRCVKGDRIKPGERIVRTTGGWIHEKCL